MVAVWLENDNLVLEVTLSGRGKGESNFKMHRYLQLDSPSVKIFVPH
jgi:hypothetical protein